MGQTGKIQKARREDLMLEGRLPLAITKMAIPSIIASLITSIYNLADAYFVSGLGEGSAAARIIAPFS